MDMLVNLYNFNENIEELENEISVKRVLAPDKYKVINFTRENFGDGWASECEYTFSNNPTSCFIAVKNKKIIGFACYDATCRGFLGPMGVLDEFRGKKVGSALLKMSLLAMKEENYAYAIIGSVGPTEFYEKEVGAVPIENSDGSNSIYSRMVDF